MSRAKSAVVWEGDGFRLIIGEALKGPVAIYALQEFDGGKYGRQEWCRINGTARECLSKIVRDYPSVPGLSAVLGVLPEEAALASKAYWRIRAEKAEEDRPFEEVAVVQAARYRALEAAAIFERGLMDE